MPKYALSTNIANDATARGTSNGGLSLLDFIVANIAFDSWKSIAPHDSADIK